MNRSRQVVVRSLAIALVMAVTVLLTGRSVRAAAPTDLFFSEYIEGSSLNKALEIYNGTGATIDLAAGSYNVVLYSNGSSSIGTTFNLTGTVADGDVYVIADDGAATAILTVTDETFTANFFNGNDAVVLRKGTTVLDVIGQIGTDPGSQWGSGLTSTADNTLRRQSAICAGDTNGADAFDPSLEWDGYANDTFDGLGSHTATCSGLPVDAAPAVVSTTPTNGATDVPVANDLSVTFSEDVDAAGGSFGLSCTVSSAVTLTVTGGPTTFTLNPDSDLAEGEECTLTITAAGITDQDDDDPPDAMAADVVVTFTTYSSVDVCTLGFTPIYDIQGNGASAAITGVVTTQGVVVGDFEGATPALRGFYLQDATGDADPATSDGIFVFNGNNNNVAVGDVIRVTGSAADYQFQTQISSVSALDNCGTGTVTPVDISFPVPSTTYLEQYEGMLVRIPQTMFVTEHFQLGRFGQVVMSGNARLQQPTNVTLPGAPAAAIQAANDLNKIIVDDPLNQQNPDPIIFGRGGNPLSAANTLRGGDTAANMVGVMTYTYSGNSASGNAYRLRPVGALGGGLPDFQAINLRPASAPAPTGDVRVAGMNLLNYFNTFDGLPDTVNNCSYGVGGAPADCRGADDQTEFDRQWAKTIAAITGTQADVISIAEIENDGYGAASAIQELVKQLNDATVSGTYAFIDVDTATGQTNALGTDAIKVGMLYKPARVTPVGTTAALNTVSFVTGGDSDDRNRPALAQAFQDNGSGEQFIVTVNHLKSKGSACDDPDTGDGQANCSIVRTNAAIELAAWLATDPTGTGDPDVLIMGDLNSYAKEDPIAALETAGYTNLISTLNGINAYSYVFDGQWGYLDYALGSASILTQVSGVAEWHINADEPSVLDYNTDFKSAGQIADLYAPNEFRISDHDPVLVDLAFAAEPIGFCPAGDAAVGRHLTDLLGTGQSGRTRKIIVPHYTAVEKLYGQLAALDVGTMKYVRFLYPDKTKEQIQDATSQAYKLSAVSWWGTDLHTATYIKGQFFWGAKANRSPRAFVLWPTYGTDESYADVLTLFDVSSENHVAWEAGWIPEQTQVIAIPATQAAGADVLVKLALVDVNKDARPVILTVSVAGLPPQTLTIYHPNAKNLLNIEEILLENVPAGTSQVEIKLFSPSPSPTYPAGGDSAAMIGAAVSYACEAPAPLR